MKDEIITVQVQIRDITLANQIVINDLNPFDRVVNNLFDRFKNSLKAIIKDDIHNNEEYRAWKEKDNN